MEPSEIALLALIGCVVVTFFNIVVWHWFLSRKRLMQDLPTSATKGVALGLNELKGVAQTNEVVLSPQSVHQCVWWKNEHFSRSSSDKPWRKVGESEGGPLWFHLVDDHGSIPVGRLNASIRGELTYDSDRRGSSMRSAGSTQQKRVVEHVIKLGSPVYVVGTAQLPHNNLNVQIGADRRGNDPFLISVGTEARAVKRQRIGAAVFGLATLLSAAALGVAWRDGELLINSDISWDQIDPVAPLMFGGFTLMVMALISLVFIYNGLVRLRQRALAAWGLIDVQLRRRHDLIPNLERVVVAHSAHESELLQAVAALRGQIMADLPAEPSDELVPQADRAIAREEAALDRVLALAEANPELMADQSWAALRHALVDTEDRVALAREFYNNSVQVLHDRAQAFPGIGVAWAFGLDLEAAFEHGDNGPGVRSGSATQRPAATAGAPLRSSS